MHGPKITLHSLGFVFTYNALKTFATKFQNKQTHFFIVYQLAISKFFQTTLKAIFPD